MADPIIDNAVRVQCIWQAPSGLPEDRFVTSWAFIRAVAGAKVWPNSAEEISERLREFWLEPVAPRSDPVASYLPNSVTAQGLEIRCYDLGQAPPREPAVFAHETTAGSSSTPLPREVAVTLSFYADRNIPRHRGRVFIGPLASNTLAGTSSSAVHPNLQASLTEAANRLAHGRGASDDMQWAVLSQMDAEIRPASDGWVDNAFDTIRKRGAEATDRMVWPPAA